ncbi:uncharacterized protein TRAVEDRAFT_51003 [Trametes versicolor FP-101664 SS1]|uniref:uncharacterized protein n=1 Tax=Trametes versicolor (strain FP-101664) TaxID=717944 RepID=UPI0004623753|nr:uncharacterized protein TRAVEDRAFT_51003 [Trametes versicolor FP-101664 SS1]EIW54866.1 hypothetical protein TRAVEDRAFT_51003 [Trametes versicolor FP-101664 SS1]
MDVDGEGRNGRDADRGELKIRGQADAERRKDQSMDIDSEQVDKAELARRESELKEKALRNKVVRTRKTSGSANAASGSGSGSGN